MKVVIALTILCSIASPVHAQHRIDVTAEHERLREPSVGEGYRIVCGTAGTSGYRPPHLPLELTVVSFNPIDLTQGDTISFEVMIKNIGKEPIVIPWSVIGSNQLALCRTEQRLLITFTTPTVSSPFPHLISATMLYGFPFDQSLLPLQPGETANIRADWQLRMDDASQEPTEIEVTPTIKLFHGGFATEEVVARKFKIQVRARPRSQ